MILRYHWIVVVTVVPVCVAFSPGKLPPHKYIASTTTRRSLRVDDDDENDSLSYMVASPERYADTLGLTLEQVQAQKAARAQSIRALQTRLAQTSDGATRHRLQCQHRLEHGKHPFVCKICWSYQPICMCRRVPTKKISLPPACQQVILWTHHSEWGSPSNTGSVLPLLLEDTNLFMKGLHEERLEAILSSDPNVQPIVLWPNVNPRQDDKAQSDKGHHYVTFHDLVGKKVILLAMEGTWRQARRMVGKFPYPRLSLDADTTANRRSSLLAPLRCQHDGPLYSVCTAEAVVSALEGMGMDPDPSILEWVRHKVDQTRRYQGKPKRSASAQS